MSASEIADNKWELQASKPPLGSAGGIMQLIFMAGFCGVFLYLIIFSIIGAVTPKPEDGGLAGQYKNMKVEGTKAEGTKAEAEE
ncbi:hypothetical protein [Paraliomyxa miuraensis]|uniref:hypothetical protein n=1 Tax=Paraliomyxa miuraensis TaxID=376150 RepID=UPI00225AED34|nr:hypothetical protein [Paraliomyxa miuraensis]MCX4245052.1 hypothetical protein [Paraliomyxa miuraensis]